MFTFERHLVPFHIRYTYVVESVADIPGHFRSYLSHAHSYFRFRCFPAGLSEWACKQAVSRPCMVEARYQEVLETVNQGSRRAVLGIVGKDMVAPKQLRK